MRRARPFLHCRPEADPPRPTPRGGRGPSEPQHLPPAAAAHGCLHMPFEILRLCLSVPSWFCSAAQQRVAAPVPAPLSGKSQDLTRPIPLPAEAAGPSGLGPAYRRGLHGAGTGRSVLLKCLSDSFYCCYESSTERNRDSGDVLIK